MKSVSVAILVRFSDEICIARLGIKMGVWAERGQLLAVFDLRIQGGCEGRWRSKMVDDANLNIPICITMYSNLFPWTEIYSVQECLQHRNLIYSPTTRTNYAIISGNHCPVHHSALDSDESLIRNRDFAAVDFAVILCFEGRLNENHLLD